MDFKIIERLLDFFFSKGYIAIRRGIVIILIALYFLQSSFFAQRWGEPNWSYEEDEIKGDELIIGNEELNTGSAIIFPQVEVIYNDEIVLVITIKNYYSHNKAEMKKVENKSLFELVVPEANREKLKCLNTEINLLVKDELKQRVPDKKIKFQTHIVRVAEISYQNVKSNKGKTNFLLCSSESVRKISEKHAKLRWLKYKIDLNTFRLEESAALDEISKECAKRLIDEVN